MTILEEQNMNVNSFHPFKANSEAPNVLPSAKKVYSKPMLVVLEYLNTAGKFPVPQESGLPDQNPAMTGPAS